MIPLLFDGSIDQAETWLTQFVNNLKQRGELVDVNMEDSKFPATALVWRERFDLVPMSDTMGMRRFKIAITTQVDNELRTSDLGHMLLTPLPKSTRLEMATLESRTMRDAIEGFWEKLRAHMRADAVLIEALLEAQPEPETSLPQPEPGWWPKKDDTRSRYLDAWRTHIRPQHKKGYSLEEIAAQMNTHVSRVSRIRRFGMSWEEYYPAS